MNNKSSNDRYGFLVWYTVPGLDAPYAELEQLAEQVGFPTDLVPKPPTPRGAWERATGLGAKGIEVDAPGDLVNRVRLEHGVEPVVRILSRTVSNSAPVLRRHLVREAVVSRAGKVSKRLSHQTVAVMEFDVTNGSARSTIIPDADGWVNGSVQDVVDELHDRMKRHLTHAGGHIARRAVRDFLWRVHRVSMRGTGGVYFVPMMDGVAEDLLALRAFVNGLAPWGCNGPPSCNVVTLHGDDAFSIRDDVMKSAVDELKERLQELYDKVQPVLKGDSKGKNAEGLSQRAMEGLLEAKQTIEVYRASLGDELQMLDDMLAMAQNDVLRAVGMS